MADPIPPAPDDPGWSKQPRSGGVYWLLPEWMFEEEPPPPVLVVVSRFTAMPSVNGWTGRVDPLNGSDDEAVDIIGARVRWFGPVLPPG